MKETICLDKRYSTTRLLTKEMPVIESKESDKFKTVLFLPEGEGRKGEGGLRTKGYFKKSYPDKPLITVITVVFNGEKYLEETIKNVINQTYDNVEYIIIDGGSTDGTLDIIKKYEDKIDYWVSEKDEGIYDAMNKGIDLATGEWLNFMNAGDKFNNNYILSTINFTLLHNYFIIYGDARIKKGNINIIQKQFNRHLDFSKSIIHQSMFYNWKYIKFTPFNINYKIMADYDNLLSISVTNKKRIKYINLIVCEYNYEGISSNPLYTYFPEYHAIIKKRLPFKIYLYVLLYLLPRCIYSFFKIFRKVTNK